MGELMLFREQYNELFCFEYTVKNGLSLRELEELKNSVEQELKSMLLLEEMEKESLVDYVETAKGIGEGQLVFSVQLSEKNQEKIELFLTGRTKYTQQVYCTFFLQVFLSVNQSKLLERSPNAFLQEGFEHREYKRRMRKKISLLFS